jgi:hypothetical protein
MDTVLSRAALPAPAPPANQRAIIERALRGQGATALRTAPDRLWIVGRAPSGALFELYRWPDHGYYIARHPSADMPAEPLGVFPTGTVAVDHALRA